MRVEWNNLDSSQAPLGNMLFLVKEDRSAICDLSFGNCNDRLVRGMKKIQRIESVLLPGK